jgi:hypothetical protein
MPQEGDGRRLGLRRLLVLLLALRRGAGVVDGEGW